MTAIVGTLNRRGIAFAADSAATLTLSEKSKITNHANKVFALSKKHPVGIAIYNNLDFHGVPWEEIFKMYRNNHLKDNSFSKLVDYADDFWIFVTDCILPKLADEQRRQVAYMASRLKDEIIVTSRKKLEDAGITVDNLVLLSEMEDMLQELSTDFSAHSRALGFDGYEVEEFERYSASIVDSVIGNILKDPDCPADFKERFLKALFEIMMSTEQVYVSHTGLVFWGYGEDELFPSYYEYHVTLAFDGRVKRVKTSEYEVSNNQDACVAPFAQTDVANTVVRGIDQELRNTINNGVIDAFDNFRNSIITEMKNAGAPTELTDVLAKIDTRMHANSFIDDINIFIKSKYTDKLLITVSMLEKEDLADMAESLVKMTCLKRHVTTDEESVGGPVDVAVITKGDGFVWIKRKHYFSPNLNQDFIKRN